MASALTRAEENVTEDLDSLEEGAFRDMVNADLRGQASSDISRRLRAPENVSRWHAALLSMSKSVEGQLAARRADWEGSKYRLPPDQIGPSKELYLKQRASTIRFKTGVDECLAEAKRLLDNEGFERFASDERASLARHAQTLTDAIRTHRDKILADPEGDNEDADEKLWSVIS